MKILSPGYVDGVFAGLSSRRPIFFSKEDLAYELASEFRKRGYTTRVGVPVEIDYNGVRAKMKIDLLVRKGATCEAAISVIYWTTELDLWCQKERYRLPEVVDVGASAFFTCCWEHAQLQSLVSDRIADAAYLFFLTNRSPDAVVSPVATTQTSTREPGDDGIKVSVKTQGRQFAGVHTHREWKRSGLSPIEFASEKIRSAHWKDYINLDRSGTCFKYLFLAL